MASYEQYIREAAAKRGIDPDIAVRVARSEGGLTGNVQSGVMKNGRRETSYGPFQLLVGGGDSGFPEGMGNDFMRKTGMHPSDPNAVLPGIDFALDGAAKNGWGAWYGAAKAGIGNRQGIPGGTPAGAPRGGISMGAPQGNVAPNADGTMPPLPAAPDIQTAAAKPIAPDIGIGQQVGNAIFGEDLAASLKKTFGPDAPANSTGKSALGLLGSAMGGGKSSQADQQAQTITPSSISVDDSQARMAAGSQLMSALLAGRKKPGIRPGLSMGA